MNFDKVRDAIIQGGSGGVITLLLVYIFASYSGIIVWGSTHQEIVNFYSKQLSETQADRDEWKKTALHGLETAKEVATHQLVSEMSPDNIKPANELTPKEVNDILNVVKAVNR